MNHYQTLQPVEFLKYFGFFPIFNHIIQLPRNVNYVTIWGPFVKCKTPSHAPREGQTLGTELLFTIAQCPNKKLFLAIILSLSHHHSLPNENMRNRK